MKWAILAAFVVAGMAWAEPAASTRPVQAPEPDAVGNGESAAVEVEKDGYKAKVTWYPGTPAPGDQVRFRLLITVPGGGPPTLLVKVTVTKVSPGEPVDVRPKAEVAPESTPQDGRYVFSSVPFAAGTYRLTVDMDDLEAGRSVKFEFPPVTIGTARSNGLPYGIGIAGLALIVIILAFGLRRPAA